MQKASLSQRTRYYFENTMSQGPLAIIKWLAIVSLAIVLFCGVLMLIFSIKGSPDAEGPLGFIEGAWQSLMATLDSGTMGGDEGWSFRGVRFIATLSGIFIISILIGAISSGIDEQIDELKKGKSKVLESNHTLILGYSEKIFSIISELVIANENQKNPSIVILSNKEKTEVEDEIRSKVEDTKNTRIIVRHGSPLESSDIAVVSPNEARSIIILANEGENADTYTIKSVLALTNGKRRKKEPYHIVAEIKDVKNMEAAELVGNGETVFVLSSDLISRVTAQTCRQSGLSIVYSELLQFDGDEIYFHGEKKLAGKTFKDALFDYETSSVIGIFTTDEKVLLNPPMDTVINDGDEVIAISEDDDTVVLSGKTSFGIDESAINSGSAKETRQERTLILGWNARGIRIIEELDNYVALGSEVLVLNDHISEELEGLAAELKNQKLILQVGNINHKATLVGLKPEEYDHIILLSNTEIDVQESDAKTLITLLHLRNISEQTGKDFSIVSEMLDIRNRELAEVAKADDFIVSDNLVSLMLSQMSENKNLEKVYGILFEADGSEIYLKPAVNYIKPGVEVNFYTVVESAARKNEVAIGYRLLAHERDSDKNYGIKINPNKADTVTFGPDDVVIVLAED